MGKSRGMGFDDFGRLSDMNDDGVTMAMADPLSSTGGKPNGYEQIQEAMREPYMPTKKEDGVKGDSVTVDGGFQPSVEIDRKFTGRTQMPDGTIVSDSEAISHRNTAISKAKSKNKMGGYLPKEEVESIKRSYKPEMSETMVSRNPFTGDHEADILSPVSTLPIGTNLDQMTYRENRPGATAFLKEHGNEAQRQFASGNLREKQHVRESGTEEFANAVNANAGAGISTGNMDVDRKNSFATMEGRDATTPTEIQNISNIAVKSAAPVEDKKSNYNQEMLNRMKEKALPITPGVKKISPKKR